MKANLALAVEKGIMEGRRVCVPELNELAHRSAGAWRHQFRDQYGLSLRDYQKLFKIRYACYLAKWTGLSALEISCEIGCDCARFSRTFKSVLGVTPWQFKQLPRQLAEKLIETHLNYNWQHDFQTAPPTVKGVNQ